MNVLLIYPEFPDTFWSFKYALKFIRKKAAYPPLGLLTVAAMLPGEFHRRLVDTNVSGLSDDDLAWADIAFIGAMAVQRDSAKQIIARCKATGLKVVAGGPLFTAEPDSFKEVDHLVLDEAELTLPSFLEDLKSGHVEKIYKASGFCVFPFQHCTGISGQGAFPLLAFNDLDAGAQTQTASPGHYPCHIWLSFPENMRNTYSLSRVADYPTKPEGICRKQMKDVL